MAKSNPLARFATIVNTRGDTVPKPVDLDSYMVAYMVDVWTYACMRVLGDWLESLPIYIERRRLIDGKWEWETVDDHPLSELIVNANPDQSFAALINQTSMAIDATGNGYNTYDPADNELWYASPKWIEVQVDQETGRVGGYVAKNGGMKRILETEEVVHYRLPNPQAGYYGESPIGIIKNQLLTKLYLSQYLKSYFKNGTMVGTTLTTDRALSSDQRDVMRKEFVKLHGGPENAGKIAILEDGTKLDKLSHALTDLMPIDLYKIIREEVLAAYQTPPVMVGVLDHASYANADNQKKIFVENRALPRLKLIEDALNRVLLAGQDDYRIRYDRSAIPALQDGQDALSLRVRGEYRDGLITLNEARAELNYEPDTENGDSYYIENLTNLGFGMSGGIGGDQTQERRLLASGQKSGDDPHLHRWKLHYSRVTTLEKRMQRIMSEFFYEQADRVVTKLREITLQGRAMSVIGLHLTKGLADDADWVFDTMLENVKLREAAGSIMVSAMLESARDEIERLGVGMFFDVDNPRVHDMIAQYHNRLVKVNDTTYEEIKRILSQSYEDGAPLAQTERAIREQFDMFSKVRSTRIAKTEMNGVVNGGQWLADKQAGVDSKMWISANLPTSREHHIAASGQVVGIDDLFQVGGSRLRWSSDSAGPAHDVINCYCTYQGVFKEDLQ